MDTNATHSHRPRTSPLPFLQDGSKLASRPASPLRVHATGGRGHSRASESHGATPATARCPAGRKERELLNAVEKHVSCWLARLLLLGRWQVSTRSRPPGFIWRERMHACMRCRNQKHPCMHAWHLRTDPWLSPAGPDAVDRVALLPMRRQVRIGLASARQHDDSCASSAPLWHDSAPCGLRWQCHISRVQYVRRIVIAVGPKRTAYCICCGAKLTLFVDHHSYPRYQWYAVHKKKRDTNGMHSSTCSAVPHPIVHSFKFSLAAARNGIEGPVGCYWPKLYRANRSIESEECDPRLLSVTPSVPN